MLPKNTFTSINKFPGTWGSLVFPISMSKIGTSQATKELFKVLEVLREKEVENKTGCNILYGDMLYMWNTDRDWKEYSMKTISQHSNAFEKELKKRRLQFQVCDAFTMNPWSLLYILHRGNFHSEFTRIMKQAHTDSVFRNYLEQDSMLFGKELTESQMGFFIEEHIFLLYIMYKQVVLPNVYTQGRDQWVLTCYPGVPPKHLVYMHQTNMLKVPPASITNPYIGFYDWTKDLFYNLDNIDLSTWDYQ